MPADYAGRREPAGPQEGQPPPDDVDVDEVAADSEPDAKDAGTHRPQGQADAEARMRPGAAARSRPHR